VLYWKETAYDRRGYFGGQRGPSSSQWTACQNSSESGGSSATFWYDVAQPPGNAVECLIQALLPLTGRAAEVVGTEWCAGPSCRR
jgi:hypothetical protein